MPSLKASPQNPALGAIASLLRSARNAGNILHIPSMAEEDGSRFGLGSLLLGKSPEEVTEWSYGNAPFQQGRPGIGSAIPSLKAGRAEGVADTLFAGWDVGALSTLAPRMARTAALPADLAAQIGAMDPNRRNFLKGMGALGAAGALGVVPDVVKKGLTSLDEVVPAATRELPPVSAVADEVAPVASRAAGRSLLSWANPGEFLTDFYNRFGAGTWTDEASDIGGEKFLEHNLKQLMTSASPEQAESLSRVMSSINDETAYLGDLIGTIPPEQLFAKVSNFKPKKPLADDELDNLLEQLSGWEIDATELTDAQLHGVVSRLIPNWKDWDSQDVQTLNAINNSIWNNIDGADDLLAPALGKYPNVVSPPVELPSPWDADYLQKIRAISDKAFLPGRD